VQEKDADDHAHALTVAELGVVSRVRLEYVLERTLSGRWHGELQRPTRGRQRARPCVRFAVHLTEPLVRREAAVNVAVDHVVNLGALAVQVPLRTDPTRR
jgi:hypothetical protein